MKKVFTSFFLLLLGVMATYATDYGLKVGGVNVTSTGYVSVGQSQGTIYWDGSTLTLTNVSFSGSTSVISYEGTTNITLKFVGINTLSTSYGNVIYCSNANLTIDGGKAVCATANLKYTGDDTWAGIYIRSGKQLTIKYMFLNVNSNKNGIIGAYEHNETLDVFTSVLHVKTNSGGQAVSRFASATFDNRDAYLTGGAVLTPVNTQCAMPVVIFCQR